MKVTMTAYGVPFGRVMNYEIAMIYFTQTRHAIKGLSWKVVSHE